MTQTPTVDQLKKVVPEQPRLTPEVKPAGQMAESAFVDPPWLLERTGEGYIQVPKPLYRIAERADGEHTLDDIAREVGEVEGRGVSADNVRQLVATQFIPRGLVAARDGTVVPRPPSARSALAVARMKTIDGQLLAGITRVLQLLYWPPVLVAVLALATLAQGWLYVVHGVGASLHDAFYAPGFMLFVLTAIVVSAGFHELGHAAALRYAGGTPRAFGFGMYLMYPAFFTDVSDNYRLRRWARIRTDLGGFYFNLIFALGIFALYVLTRQEVLLVMIVLMNFEIIHQLLPLVRLDGYWTLADLTGIPDFFSRMGAFVRSILPRRLGGRERAMPALKWWGKAVFLGYIVVTIPALAILLLLMLRNVPRVLATGWDALGQQGQAVLQAQAGGNVLGIAGGFGQSVLILLPVAGLLFSLYRVGTGVGRWLWRWSAGSTQRRGLVGLAGLAFAALIILLWAPQLPLFGRPNPLFAPATFQPIDRAERLSLADALAGVVTERTADAELPAWLAGPRSAASPSEAPATPGGPVAPDTASGLAGARPAGAPTSQATGANGSAPADGRGAGGGSPPSGVQLPAAGVDGQLPAAGVDGQLPAAGVDGQLPAAGVDGQLPAAGVDAAQLPAAGAADVGAVVGALATPAAGTTGGLTSVQATVAAAPGSAAVVPTTVTGVQSTVTSISAGGASAATTAVPAVIATVQGVATTGSAAVPPAVAPAVPGLVATAVPPVVATAVPPIASQVPAVATQVGGVATPVPPVATAVATQVPPVATAVSATATVLPVSPTVLPTVPVP